MSEGITIAASTSPDATLLSAAARVGTCTTSTWLNSCFVYSSRPTRAPPSVIVSPGGVSSTIATRGLEGLAEIAKPINSAIATG